MTDGNKHNDEYGSSDIETKIHVYMPYLGLKAYIYNKELIKGSLVTTDFVQSFFLTNISALAENLVSDSVFIKVNVIQIGVIIHTKKI